jgi:cell division septation protein DedD
VPPVGLPADVPRRAGGAVTSRRRGALGVSGSGLRIMAREHSWGSLSGWGVALVVTLVAAPAVRGYWFMVDGGCRMPAPVTQGEKAPVVTQAIPEKPAPQVAGQSASRGSLLKEANAMESDGAPVKMSGLVEQTPDPTGPVAPLLSGKEAGQGEGSSGAAALAKPIPAPGEGAVPPGDAQASGRTARSEQGMESMYHSGKKAEPIPLDFKFTIQVGSFLEKESAFRRASELRRKGYDAYILESLGKRDTQRLWQSVRMGRFQDRKTAQDALEMYKRKENDKVAYVALHESGAGSEGDKPGSAVESTLVTHTPTPSVQEKPAPRAATQPVAQPTAQPTAQPEAKPVVGKPVKAASGEMDRELAAHLFQQSLAFRNNRDLVQEEAILRQTLQKDPDHGLARNRLARIMVESNRTEEGLKVLQGAVHGRSPATLVGDDPNLAAFLAALYQRQEEHGQAVELYQTLLSRHPDRGIWRMGLAISLEKMGKTQQALDAYQESLTGADLSAKLRGFVQTRLDHLK